MTTPETTPEAIPVENQLQYTAYFRKQQNLPMAVIAGLAAALVSAVIWAAVTVATEYQIGWMAIGVGILVGFSVRLGKGIDKLYGQIGAVLALLGCILGNFFSLVGFIAKQEEMGVFEVLGLFDYPQVPSLMMETSSPMDLLFYGIAIFQGYKFSTRTISPEAMEEAQQALG